MFFERGDSLGMSLLQPGALDLDLGGEGRIIVHSFEFRFGGVAVVGVDAPLFHISEEGLQFVKVPCLDRVEFVIVAFGAAEGAAKPGRGDRADALGTILGEILLRLGSALARHHVEPVVAGRDELLGRGIRDQIAGELFAGEDVKGLVPVEGVDDVIAIRKDALVLVAVESDGVGVARDVEPPDGQTFAEVGRVEERVDGDFTIQR